MTLLQEAEALHELLLKYQQKWPSILLQINSHEFEQARQTLEKSYVNISSHIQRPDLTKEDRARRRRVWYRPKLLRELAAIKQSENEAWNTVATVAAHQLAEIATMLALVTGSLGQPGTAMHWLKTALEHRPDDGLALDILARTQKVILNE